MVPIAALNFTDCFKKSDLANQKIEIVLVFKILCLTFQVESR